MKQFFLDLIDKNSPKCPKVFCGIIGFLVVCGTTIYMHDTASLTILSALVGTALAINMNEINKNNNGGKDN
jgi:hypothetical protein